MALTSNSFQADPQPPRNSQADADAAVNSFDGVRMDRMHGSADVAASHTTGPASDSAIGEAFIDGSTIKQATPTANKQTQVANVPVGDPTWPPAFTGGNAMNK